MTLNNFIFDLCDFFHTDFEIRYHKKNNEVLKILIELNNEYAPEDVEYIIERKIRDIKDKKVSHIYAKDFYKIDIIIFE